MFLRNKFGLILKIIETFYTRFYNLKKQKRIKEMVESNDLMLKIKKSLGEKEIEKDKEIIDKMNLENQKEEEEEKIKKRIKMEKND